MADMTIDEAVKQYKEAAKDITVKAAESATQGPKIVEGNTGTLTVVLLDQVNQKLAKILEFIDVIKQEKV